MAQSDFPEKLQKAISDFMKSSVKLDNEMAEGSVGGGLVTVVIKGNYQVVSVKIDPQVVDPEDVETLQDLIVVATNDAMKKIRDRVKRKYMESLGVLGLTFPNSL